MTTPGSRREVDVLEVRKHGGRAQSFLESPAVENSLLRFVGGMVFVEVLLNTLFPLFVVALVETKSSLAGSIGWLLGKASSTSVMILSKVISIGVVASKA